MKKIIIICLTLLSSIGFAQPYSATDQVIVSNINNPALWGRGFDFTPNVNITITQLGKRVPTVATYIWNIWQVNTQTLIHAQTSTSTTPGIYTYENISAPVTLLAGVEYCLTLYGDGNTGGQYYFGNSSQINSHLTYNTMRYCNACGSLQFPTQTLGGFHYGTPDFMFNVACAAPTITCPGSIAVDTDPGLCAGTAVFPTTMVLQYDPTGTQNANIPVAPFFQAPNFTAGNLSQLGQNAAWGNTGVWPVGQISSSPTPLAGQYVTFQVTVPSGTDFARLQYTKNSYLGNGATSATIRSSLDGFTSNIKTIPVNPGGAQELIFDLRGMPFVSGPITFRIYFYGAPTNNADWDDLVSTTFGGGGLRLYVNNLATVTGTCLPLTISYTNFPSNDQFNLGMTTVTVTVTDGNGNSASCNFNVNVTDNEDPVITPCPPALTVNADAGQCYATISVAGLGTPPVATDNCGTPVISNNAPPNNHYPVGGTYVTWEAADASGNKADCQQLVTVIDNQPPVALCKNICVYLGSDGTATITGADIDNGSYDNCALDPGPNGLVASQTSFSYADAGPNTVTLTVLDINGNTSTCTAVVTVGEYYTLFGAGPACSTPSGTPDACHVNIGNGNTVSGNVGSYRLITTGGGVVINGNVYSGGKVNYANGVSSKSVSAANSLGVPGIIFGTGNSAGITGDVNVQGNININPNAGSFVTGIVRHPSGTTYSGPVPGGGVLVAAPVLPALPGMPAINAYGCGGANITTTATLIPGSYGNLTLGNAAGVVITFAGPGNYYFSRISMGQGGIHTFKYDFLGLPGKINIFVCGDIDFGTHYSQWANPNTPDACRVYFETHGTGSTNGTNSVMSAVIALGSQFYGRIWAPYGGIKIGSGSCCTYATGSFWSAKQVQLEGAVTIYRCGSACPPGPRIGQDGATAEDMKDMLQVYPNPTTGQTTVSFFAETPDNYSLKVMDYQGRVVLSNQIKSIAGDNTVEVDMSQFAKGLYLIEVGNADHSQKVKLVVQ